METSNCVRTDMKEAIAAILFDWDYETPEERPHEEVCHQIAEAILNTIPVFEMLKALKSVAAVAQKARDNKGFADTPGIWMEFADAMREVDTVIASVEGRQG